MICLKEVMLPTNDLKENFIRVVEFNDFFKL